MDYRQRVENFLANPTENLNVELKETIDLDTNEGKAKLIRNCIALFNKDGGMLAIGFDDEGQFHTGFTKEEAKAFHPDIIQTIVSQYCSTRIEINVYFYERHEMLYPFIFIPSGIKSPAFVKKDLLDDQNQKNILRQGSVFIRTLSSSGVVSSSQPREQNDWDVLINLCLENKETDIAKFFQKNLTSMQIQKIRDYFEISPSANTQLKNSKYNCIEYGYTQLEQQIKNIPSESLQGSFQVAFKINDPSVNLTISQSLLDILKSSNPSPSGWPLWVILLNSPDETKRPQYHKHRYEAFIKREDALDFWVITKEKCFYHYRTLEEDLKENFIHLPFRKLDFALQIECVSDAITTGIAFAKALNASLNTHLSFSFKWDDLKNRELGSWKYPNSTVNCLEKPNENNSQFNIQIPINTSKSGIIGYTYEIVSDLFLNFGGYDGIKLATVREIIENYFNWKN